MPGSASPNAQKRTRKQGDEGSRKSTAPEGAEAGQEVGGVAAKQCLRGGQVLGQAKAILPFLSIPSAAMSFPRVDFS